MFRIGRETLVRLRGRGFEVVVRARVARVTRRFLRGTEVGLEFGTIPAGDLARVASIVRGMAEPSWAPEGSGRSMRVI